jgi:hypothetical protein
MIVRLILPEGSFSQAQYPLGAFGGYAFQPLQDARHGDLGLPHHVNVIRHHNKCMQILKPANRGAVSQRFDDHAGYAWVF